MHYQRNVTKVGVRLLWIINHPQLGEGLVSICCLFICLFVGMCVCMSHNRHLKKKSAGDTRVSTSESAHNRVLIAERILPTEISNSKSPSTMLGSCQYLLSVYFVCGYVCVFVCHITGIWRRSLRWHQSFHRWKCTQQGSHCRKDSANRNLKFKISNPNSNNNNNNNNNSINYN